MKIFSTENNLFFIPKDFLHMFPCQIKYFKEDYFQKLLIGSLPTAAEQIPLNSLFKSKDNIYLDNLCVESSPITFSLEEVFHNAFTVENIHGNIVVYASNYPQKADAHIIAASKHEISNFSKKYLAIKTADCLPVVFAYEDETYFIGGITHAGWRGLTSGIIQNTIEKLKQEARKLKLDEKTFLKKLKVFFAPAIFGISYECGQDVALALEKYINNLLSIHHSKAEFTNIFAVCADVKKDLSLSLEIEKFAFEHGAILQNRQNIFPDIQLLGTLECVISGIPQEQITIFRENTYGHSILPSFREACHTAKSRTKRLWTYLCLP